jgi:hypothetical protein
VAPLPYKVATPAPGVTDIPVREVVLSVKENEPLVTELGVTLIVNVTLVPSQTGPAGLGVTVTVGCG